MNRSLTPGLCRDPYLCWKKPLFAGLGPTGAAAPDAGGRQRALLGLARDFVRLPGQGHRQALCLLARALADT